MGLDMYIHAFSKEAVQIVDGGIFIDKNIDPEEVMYWRKEHDLHGWMHKLHCRKHGNISPSEYNCVFTLLTLEDIDECIKDMEAYNLPETRGFFFGENPPDEESNFQNALKLLEVKEYIQNNPDKVILYSSWW